MDTSKWSEHDKKIYLEARRKLEEQRNEIIKKINSADVDEDISSENPDPQGPQVSRSPSDTENDIDEVPKHKRPPIRLF